MKRNFRQIGNTVLGLLTAMVLLLSCTKEYEAEIPGTDPVPAPINGKKLSKISYDDGSYMSIQYNAEGKPVKIVDLHKNSSGDDTYVYTLTYNGDKLVDMTLNDGTKYKYTYTGANVTKVEIVSPNQIVIAYYEYTYKDGRLWRTDGYSSFAGTITTTPNIRFETEYYADGNIKTMTSWYKGYTSGVLEKTDVYEITSYDTKKNTSLLFENNPYIPLLINMPNNPLTEKHFDKDGQQYASITHTYTYDDLGNPIKRKTIEKELGMADIVSETTFQY